MTCVEEIREWLKALTPLAIGAFAGWIAYQQWQTARHKLKLDLYDRRYKIYTAVRDVFGKVIREAKVDVPDFGKFFAETVEAKFLFPSDITNYLDTIPERMAKLRSLRDRLYGDGHLPVGAERSKVVEEEGEVLKWFVNESKELERRLMPHMGFDRIK